jgi:hypothetical protein
MWPKGVYSTVQGASLGGVVAARGGSRSLGMHLVIPSCPPYIVGKRVADQPAGIVLHQGFHVGVQLQVSNKGILPVPTRHLDDPSKGLQPRRVS